MTKEQAIRILSSETSLEEIHKLKYYAGFNQDRVLEQIQEAMDMGTDALEKQIAKDVIDITPSYSDTGVYRCPKCKDIYTFKQGKPNYCSECGQMINWNGVD